MTNDTKRIIKIFLPIIAALLSVFVLARYATSTDFHAKTIESLDDKKSTVMELTAASTAASTAITLLPGDTATPIAEKLADLSSYFLVVLCAIYLEKYLLTITGYLAFVVLIPIGCLLLFIHVFHKNDAWKYFAKKLILFGLAIVLVIPSSIKVSDMIEKTYHSSIEKMIESAKQTTEEVKQSAEVDMKNTETEGILSGFISKVTNGVSDITQKIENVLNNFIEALAVMIVTSCIIPIVVLMLYVWLVRSILGIDINFPKEEGLSIGFAKEKWLSILLDGSVPDEEIKNLIALSYELTR